MVILTVHSLPVGRRLARTCSLAQRRVCVKAASFEQRWAGAELPAVQILAFMKGGREGTLRGPGQAPGLLSTCKIWMVLSCHQQ